MKNLLRLCVFCLGTCISLDFTTSVVHFIMRLHILQNGKYYSNKNTSSWIKRSSVQPIFILLLSISRIKRKEFSYFQGNKLSKLFQKKKILVILKTTENRYLLEISDVRASTSGVWKTERGHTKSFVHRMYLFVKKPFASLLNCEYTGWMTVLSHSHLCLWVSPMGKFILNLSHHILFPGQQSDSRKIPTLLLFHLTWISRHQQISCESLGTTIWWLSLQACIQANVTEISTVIPANRCHSWQ